TSWLSVDCSRVETRPYAKTRFMVAACWYQLRWDHCALVSTTCKPVFFDTFSGLIFLVSKNGRLLIPAPASEAMPGCEGGVWDRLARDGRLLWSRPKQRQVNGWG